MTASGALTEPLVRAIEEQRYSAMLGADVATLERLLDESVTYTHSSGVIDNKTSYIAGLRDKIAIYKHIKREHERVVIRGATALVFCRLRMDLTVNGAPRHVNSNALAVWSFDGPEPRLLAVHSSPAAA
jgi:Domain of unknown function (DUF4440)